MLVVMTKPAEPLETFRAMPKDELIARYRIGVERFDTRVFELNDQALDRPFEGGDCGSWAIRVLLGHLADAEVINTLRLRKTIAEEGPVIDGWDPEVFIDGGLYGPGETGGMPAPQPIGAFVATIHTLRGWTGEWLEGLPAPAWDRRAMHAVRGAFTFRELLGLATWHLEHHGWFLNQKVAKLAEEASGTGS